MRRGQSGKQTLRTKLEWDALMADEADFLRKVMGLGDDDG